MILFSSGIDDVGDDDDDDDDDYANSFISWNSSNIR